MEKNTNNKDLENENYEEVIVDEENQEVEDNDEQELSREEELEQEVKNLKDDYLRLKADFENYRKRMQDEIQKTREKAISSFVEDLLPNIDNFEMSLKMSDNKDMFIKGVEMIHKNLLLVLENHSISMYEPQVGEEFNVKEHEPILIEHEELPPGSVAGIVSRGYKLKDSIIRPARVHVVKDSETENENKNSE